MFKFRHIFQYQDLMVLFNLDILEIIYATEFFFNQMKINTFDWVGVQNANEHIEERDEYKVYKKYVYKWITTDDCYLSLDSDKCQLHHSSYASKNSSEVGGIRYQQHSSYISTKVQKIKSKINKEYNLFISHVIINDNDILTDYIQYIIGMSTLTKDGNMIIRSYDIAVPFKIWLLSTITNYFENIWIVKPESSASYQKDYFVVGYKFKGITKNDLDKLYYILSSYRSKYINRIMSSVNIDTVQSIYKYITHHFKEKVYSKNTLIKLFKQWYGNKKYYQYLEIKGEETIDKYIINLRIKSIDNIWI